MKNVVIKMYHSYKEVLKQVGLNIVYYRKVKNLTQLELAEKVNISNTYLSQIECGLVKKFVSLPVLIDISNALDVSISELFMFK